MPGHWARLIVRDSGVGIEPEALKVETARALVGGKAEPGRLEFATGDGTAIPLPDRSVDWVWCSDVLHHIVETERALREFVRVVRPGGRVIVKESQVLSAMFLPGHPELERRIQLAEIRRTLGEGAGRSFQERRQTTPASLRAAGLTGLGTRTYMLERRAPPTVASLVKFFFMTSLLSRYNSRRNLSSLRMRERKISNPSAVAGAKAHSGQWM